MPDCRQELSPDGLRRCVQGRRAGAISREFRQPEVEHLGVPAPGDEDVGGLDVAVQDALGVRQLNRVGDLHAQVEHHRQRQRLAADEPIERLAFQVLHRDVLLALELADVVHRADARVVHRRGGLGLAFEAFERHRVARQRRGQELQDQRAAQPGVFGAINDAHAAGADLLDDPIM